MCEKCKKTLESARDKVRYLEHKVKRYERYMNMYIDLVNVVTNFIDLKPEHDLYDSICGDLKDHCNRAMGTTEYDLPMGPCEWEWSDEHKTYHTSCSRYYEFETEYCPNCLGQVIIEGTEE